MKTATRKYQATIPEPVRKVLHLGAGDVIAFDIEDNGIHVRKAQEAVTKALFNLLPLTR